MVHRLVVSYGQPDDPAAFDTYYRDTHTPLATTMPGLVRMTTGHPQPLDPSQSAPYLVARRRCTSSRHSTTSPRCAAS
jgi:uncharacterized protein (TIGR02118 family)